MPCVIGLTVISLIGTYSTLILRLPLLVSHSLITIGTSLTLMIVYIYNAFEPLDNGALRSEHVDLLLEIPLLVTLAIGLHTLYLSRILYLARINSSKGSHEIEETQSLLHDCNE